MVQTLGNGTGDQKIQVIFAMAVLDWPHITLAFPHVLKALNDQNPDVRKNALEALNEPQMITDRKPYFFAIKGCLLDEDASVRSEAASHMGVFLQRNSLHQEAIEEIIKPEILQTDENIIKNVGLAFIESGGDLELLREAMTMLHDIMITNDE